MQTHSQISISQHDLQPPLPQFGNWDGVPLYPVATTLKLFTIIAPLFPDKHAERLEAISAILMKYVSQLGRACSGFIRSSWLICCKKSSVEDLLWIILSDVKRVSLILEGYPSSPYLV